MHFLDKIFKLKDNGTNTKTEAIAGLTTFLTMVYIVFVNPAILGDAGMDKSAVFVTTCIIAGLGTIALGLFANMPIAMAPALGLSPFFAYVVVNKLGYSWQVGMGAVFIGCVAFLLLSIFQVRYWIISNIPVGLRVGIGAGIGLFIALIGFHNMGLVVASPATMVTLGDLHDFRILLGLLGFLVIIVLAYFRIYQGVLISIVAVTILALIFDSNIKFSGIVSLPPSISSVVGHVDILGALTNFELFGIIFAFMLVTLFDSSGTIISVLKKAGLVRKDGSFPNMKKALLVDSSATVVGAYLGTSALSTYIESGSGVSVGGKTGLTAVVVGILFLIALFFSPLLSIVPTYATAGALVYVGILMGGSLRKVNWDDITEATPAFLTAVMMPFTYSITEGIAFGFISYVILKALTGRFKEINLAVLIVAILFIVKFAWIG